MAIMSQNRETMQVNILLFANLRDLAGRARFPLSVPVDHPTVDDVRQAIIGEHPTLSEALMAAIAAVNQEFAFGKDSVQDGDEVAFFPPVSGGDDSYPEIFRLADGPIDHDEIIRAITIPGEPGCPSRTGRRLRRG